jgi:polysaccharide deacetylase est4E
MRKILVRFDDICPTMDWSQWNRAMKILKLYHVKPLIGVIPDCQDPDLLIDPPQRDFWDYLKSLQADGFAIAMHGYLHVYDTAVRGIVNDTFRSEFAGHSYEEQYEKIRKGKEILASHGIQTDIFFAPAHSYDENTLRALSANGFKYVSDGKSSKPFVREGIICIPCRSGGCPRIGKYGCYTAVFHAHEWKRPDKKDCYDQLKTLCEEYSEEIVDFKEYAKQKTGIPFVEYMDEKMYIFYENKIKAALRPMVHVIKSMLRNLKEKNQRLA